MSTPAVSATVTGLLLAQASSPQPGLRFENRRWSWQEHVSECARYAAALRARRRPGRPFHVGVLADNVPEFSFLLGGCAFAGAVPENAVIDTGAMATVVAYDEKVRLYDVLEDLWPKQPQQPA